MERWLLWRGGRCGEVAVSREVTVVRRWPLVGRSGRCGEMAVSREKWPLWRGGR